MTSNCNRKPPVLTLGALTEWGGGTSSLSDRKKKQTVGTVWHDSRKVGKGDVFLALTTENNDGHNYLKNAFKAGAIAAIVDKRLVNSAKLSKKYLDRLIMVTDPIKAVSKAAHRFRKEMGILMIGVTGSNGKTTTRSFIADVLKNAFAVGETYSNWNNHIGVPLSLLKFKGDEWIGVIEMGANHEGEIRGLAKIVAPDIGVLTNIGYAHVGQFGSLKQTTLAKFELVEGLNHKNGFLLINGDDGRVCQYAKKIDIPVVSYGFEKYCTVCAEHIRVERDSGVSFTVDGSAFKMPMPGRHFIYSALPAIFIGRRCGLSDEIIAEALSLMKPVDLRGAVTTKDGVDFIVDCYNANPSSMGSALTYLNDIAGTRRKVAIVGDMLELGRYAKRLHRKLGGDIVKAGVKELVAVGEYAPLVLEGAKRAGLKERNMASCDSAETASMVVGNIVNKKDAVLLKGSRGVHLETVFEKFGN